MKEALIIILLVITIIFVITLTVLCIRLMSTLNKADKLIDNVTRKAESLDGVFNVIDYTSNKFGAIGESIMSGTMSLVKKIFSKKGEEEDYE